MKECWVCTVSFLLVFGSTSRGKEERSRREKRFSQLSRCLESIRFRLLLLSFLSVFLVLLASSSPVFHSCPELDRYLFFLFYPCLYLCLLFSSSFSPLLSLLPSTLFTLTLTPLPSLPGEEWECFHSFSDSSSHLLRFSCLPFILYMLPCNSLHASYCSVNCSLLHLNLVWEAVTFSAKKLHQNVLIIMSVSSSSSPCNMILKHEDTFTHLCFMSSLPLSFASSQRVSSLDAFHLQTFLTLWSKRQVKIPWPKLSFRFLPKIFHKTRLIETNELRLTTKKISLIKR